MAKKRVLSPQSVWDQAALKAAFQEAGIANYELHTAKLWGSLIRNPESTWHDVEGLPKAAIGVLEAGFVKFTSKLHAVQRSTDGETMKLLLSLQDGLRVEAVVMKYDTTTEDADKKQGGVRSTLCVSSQVGCQMGCTFCATGTMGLTGNLSIGEIVEQLAWARQFTPVRNVVFMGMGEPLMNYDAVKAAVDMMTDTRLFSMGPRQITISTVGVVDKIRALTVDLPKVSFALSLHAPTQALREQIVPSARAYKLDKLMAAVTDYQAHTGQKVFVEYVMLKGINDNEQQAHELGALLKGALVTINLIPYNPVYNPDMEYEAPGMTRVLAFQKIVREVYQLACTVRAEKGQEISGACGQLVIDHQGKAGKSVRDIEEIAARFAAQS